MTVAERMARRPAAAVVFGCAAALAASLTSAPGLALASASPAAGPRPSSGPARPGLVAGAGEELLNVSATSAGNAWATGETPTTPSRPVILHWNGTAWSKVAIPSPAFSGVGGVSAVSAGNAWLVGNRCPDRCTKPETTLILHWNGTAWVRVPSPNPAGQVNFLSAVSASSPGDAWAVGSTCAISTGTCAPLLLHWNGTAWAQETGPAPGVSDSLDAVVTISARDAWAVGKACDPGCYGPLVLHWNGTRWSTSAVPSVGAGSSGLRGVTATSASDVWAVGNAAILGKTVILHWNGTRWSRSPSPDPGQGNLLNGVSATSPGNAWAVGSWCTTTSCAVSRTLIAHWNGTAWSSVNAPSPGTGSNLAGVAATAPGNAWAVGSNCTGDGSQCHPITLHWNGKTWAT